MLFVLPSNNEEITRYVWHSWNENEYGPSQNVGENYYGGEFEEIQRNR